MQLTGNKAVNKKHTQEHLFFFFFSNGLLIWNRLFQNYKVTLVQSHFCINPTVTLLVISDEDNFSSLLFLLCVYQNVQIHHELFIIIAPTPSTPALILPLCGRSASAPPWIMAGCCHTSVFYTRIFRLSFRAILQLMIFLTWFRSDSLRSCHFNVAGVFISVHGDLNYGFKPLLACGE